MRRLFANSTFAFDLLHRRSVDTCFSELAKLMRDHFTHHEYFDPCLSIVDKIRLIVFNMRCINFLRAFDLDGFHG